MQMIFTSWLQIIDKNNPIAKAISKIKNIEPKMISSEYDSGEEL